MEAKLPQLSCRVGRVRLPSTTHAMDRFLRALQRCYPTRGALHASLSATRALRLFVVVYLFTPQALMGQSPIAVMVSEARRIPLYHLLTDPFNALQERCRVTSKASRADVLVGAAAAAWIRGGATMQRSPFITTSMVRNFLDITGVFRYARFSKI